MCCTVLRPSKRDEKVAKIAVDDPTEDIELAFFTPTARCSTIVTEAFRPWQTAVTVRIAVLGKFTKNVFPKAKAKHLFALCVFIKQCTVLAFEMAEKYRMPAYVMADGVIGQMMESVQLPDPKPYDYDPDWKMGKIIDGKANYITSIYMEYDDLEALNRKLQNKYREIERTEQRAEEFMVDDAELVIVAYGICSRIAQGAVSELRAQGLKVGLIRPQMVYPFPNDNFKKVVENGKAKVVVSLEMSAGQMIEDVKLALECKLPVELCNRMGGNVPSCAEVCEAIKRIYKEYTK